MNVFPLISLVASVICVFSGLLVFFLNRNSLLNKLLMMGLFVNAYWAFAEFMIRQAASIETAILWSKLLFLLPFLMPLLLHFSLVFTESELLKKKLTYVFLYAPALVFSVLHLTTDLIYTLPVKQFWGYNLPVAVGSWVCHLEGVWEAALLVLTVFLFFMYHHRVYDETRKKQTKYVCVGIAIPVFLSIITDSLFPVLGIQFPGIGSFSGAVLSGFVIYAIWKYDLFTLNPAVAAENIVTTMPDSLILADLNGKILSVNQSLLDLFGYKENELIDKPALVLCSEKTASTKIFAELKKKREIKNREIVCVTKTGVEKFVAISASVVKNKRGQEVGVNCVLHDITLQKQMEQKLLEAKRYASIGELAGMIGHDLRNPLTSIKSAVYYLKTKHCSKLDDKDVLMFETIENSIAYSNKIINDLLDYSSEIKLEPESVTPKSMVNNALSIFQIPPNVRVIDFAESTYEVGVDKTQLTRVFVNILTNAIDAMPHSGKLTIKSQKLGDHVLLSFEDTGVGMTKETLSKLWNPLFTTKAKGMGFGLAICKRIVEAHGGRIWVKSVLEQGTQVTVQLPIKATQK
ncbi:MAG: ATP-binding protein [Candidatus Bathyarchaeota archaeon]|nr:ATP-binding protein [Candidatus Bathyarchaeota archaeon]